MQWFEKFKVGQKVKVVKFIDCWDGMSWVSGMNNTIGKVYKIKRVDFSSGYQLWTDYELGDNYWYPEESLASLVGEQLLFDFME